MVANLDFVVVAEQLRLQNRLHRFEQQTEQMNLEMRGE